MHKRILLARLCYTCCRRRPRPIWLSLLLIRPELEMLMNFTYNIKFSFLFVIVNYPGLFTMSNLARHWILTNTLTHRPSPIAQIVNYLLILVYQFQCTSGSSMLYYILLKYIRINMILTKMHQRIPICFLISQNRSNVAVIYRIFYSRKMYMKHNRINWIITILQWPLSECEKG